MKTHSRTHLKKRILVQNQGGREVLPGDILEYFEDLNQAPNAEFGPKDFFEIRSEKTAGFTLLEILIAIVIFSVVMTALFLSYRTLFVDTEGFESGLRQYETAQAFLNRAAEDIRSIHINLPPLYTKPDLESEPDAFRVEGGTDYVGDTQFGLLRFTSAAHVSFETPPRAGIAEIRYYVTRGDQGHYVVRRSDALYPFPPFEESTTDPIICENVKSLTYLFYDDSQEAHTTWNSESDDFGYATPSAIEVTLEIGDERSLRLFSTLIHLPTTRGRLD